MATSKDRERELARQHYERQQQRRTQGRQKTRQRGIVVASVVGLLAVIGALVAISLTGSSNKSTATLSTQPSGSANPAGTCTYTPAGKAAKNVGTPPATPARQQVAVTISTNLGAIKAVLDGAKAPCTVNSFTYLASKGYFDDTKCHRLTTSGIFVLQCGDPTATGSGGPGYQFQDENLSGATYPAGTLAMANAGPGTNGSQFFIVYKDTKLAPSYTPFGKVSSGLDIVTKVAAAGTTNGQGDGAPKLSVTITKVQVAQ